MSQYSLKQLKKHLKFCKKCQNASLATQLCYKIKTFANQDYIYNKEFPVPGYSLDEELRDSWTACIPPPCEFETQQFVTPLLQELSKIEQEIIHYRYWEGKTLREIATLLGFKSHRSIFERLKQVLLRLNDYRPSANSIPQSFRDLNQESNHITDNGRGK